MLNPGSTRRFILPLLLGFFCLHLIPKNTAAQDSLAFGDEVRVNDGLMGRVYILSPGTHVLPDFDTLKSKGIIYTRKIDVPERSWQYGFPGLPAQKEWFGIVYTADFKVKKAGSYTFRLLSDDGAKLFIDKKLIIDNDGIHVPASRLGKALLDAGKHTIRLEYFQGPKTQLALQLFATFDKDAEEIFPGNNFVLTTPPEPSTPWKDYLIYIGIGLLVILLLVLLMRRRRKPVASKIEKREHKEHEGGTKNTTSR